MSLPALHTRLKMVRAESGSDRSQATGSTSTPRMRSSSACFSRASSSRATVTRSYPSLANSRHSDSPMPLVAPVTKTV